MARKRTGLRKFAGKTYTYKKTCFSDACIDNLKSVFKGAGKSVRTVRNTDGSYDIYYR